MTLRDLLISIPAVVLAGACVLKVWRANQWETCLIELLFGFGGLVAFVFSSEFNEWQGSYGWSRSQWRHPPVEWTRIAGAGMLALASYSILVAKIPGFGE